MAISIVARQAGLALVLGTAVIIAGGPATAATRLHQYFPTHIQSPSGGVMAPPVNGPVTVVGPGRPAPVRPIFPIVHPGPAKLPPSTIYPYPPGTVVHDHRNGKDCKYIVGNEWTWDRYWFCEHPSGHYHRAPPPPWPYHSIWQRVPGY